ncbi:MAG: TonB-dependent receptor [Gammaproteobacteria bacterium]|nr:TonB-dependent receptor [Gammaproteobacteria bacterium]
MSHTTLCRGILGLVAATLVTPVVAQDDVGVLEEIVVTSTKRQSTLQEIPVAVSVVQVEDIQQSQISDIKDLQSLVPSLRVTQLQSSGNTNFLIRGFGNGANNAGIEPSVGVFVDGVYRSRTSAALGDLPNLERIEVLRGPQSTLFGKNASAGVISIVTAKPDLDQVSGSASLTVGDYSQFIVKGDITGPLSDTVGFSLSGSYNSRDGYYDNLAGGDALGELNRYSARGQLLFAPSDALEVRVIADFDSLDEACCGVANLLNGPTGAIVVGIGGNLVPESPFAYQGYYDFTPVNQFDTGGVSVQFDYDLNDSVSLTSITALRNLDRFDNVDVDFTSAPLLDAAAGNLTDVNIDTLTQEFRLTGSTDRMDWLLGAFFFDEEVEQNTAIRFGPLFRTYADILTSNPAFGGSGLTLIENLGTLGVLPSVPANANFFANGQGNTESAGLDNQALSIFGQIDIELGDRATLTLGANYTEDEKEAFVNVIGDEIFSSLDLTEVGYEFVFLNLTGLPAIPAVLPGFPVEDATARFLSTVPCTPATGAACNPFLGFVPFQFLPQFVDIPNVVENGRSKDDDTTWTIRLAFDVSDNVNMYLGAGTGFKATSWNLSRDSVPFPSDASAVVAAGLTESPFVPGTQFFLKQPGTRSAAPEEATVYEIGLKASWDTVSMNLAIFDQEIENFQLNIFTGAAFSLLNAGTQSTTGAEIDIRWLPTDNFQGTLAATIMDPKYDSFEVAAVPRTLSNPSGVGSLTGATPAGIHELSLTASGRFNFTMGNADGFVRAEYIYEDKIQVVDNIPASIASREVNTVNASIGLAWENGFEAMLWGRNITDDEYLLSAFPSVAQPGSVSGYPNQPRTYGLTVRKYFD